jgi:KaiC/GvpD/RAD55 family RecA-like ATPase
MAEKVQTGVSGLDKMLYGGIPDKSMVLLSGGPGAGKTLLSFEFLYRNAKMGHTGAFFALEEEPGQLVSNVKAAFTELTDIDDVLNSGKLVINAETPSEDLINDYDEKSNFEFGKVMADIESVITSTKAERVVIDSVSVLDIMIRNPTLYRKYMLAMLTNLRRLGVTALMTIELESPERDKLVFKPEYFIFDGIIALYQTGEESRRMLASEVLKMRGTRHSFVTTPYDITSSGFRLFAAEDIAPY